MDPSARHELEHALRSIDGEDRGARLAAVFQLGEALAAAGESDIRARALARLEALASDREAGSWLRKRAKRALEKIRGRP